MRNGLYRVEFQTQLGHGTGVVFLHDGHLHGGDTGMYYVGSYQLSNDDFTATVAGHRHSQNLASVFGIDDVNITLNGKFQGDNANTQGSAAEAPGVTFKASLARLCD